MIPGETILSGAPAKCPNCGVSVKFKVCQSAAGFYIGTECACGPYSRESGYFGTKEECQSVLNDWERGNIHHNR